MAEVYLVWAAGSIGSPLMGPFETEEAARASAETLSREDGGQCVVIGPVPGFVVGDESEE
jgi:uncharacterized membrane protein